MTPPSTLVKPRFFLPLFRKNLIVKVRAPLSFACEILLPLAFVGIMAALFFQFDTITNPPTAFSRPTTVFTSASSPGYLQALPFHPVPYRLQQANQKLAIVGSGTPATIAERDAFVADMRARYPPFNATALFTSLPIYFPGFGMNNTLLQFDSEADLTTYIKSPSYRFDVWAAIVFRAPRPNLDYAIRMNISDIPSTLVSPVNILSRGVDLNTVRRYVSFNPSAGGNPFAQATTRALNSLQMPGFTTLQLMLDRWAINSFITLPVTPPTPEETAGLLAVGLRLLSSLLPMVTTDFSALARLTAEVQGFDPIRQELTAALLAAWYVPAESYAPQEVSFVPFPVAGYSFNNFYTTVLPLMSFFFLMTILFPVSRLIRGLVIDKETKAREGLKMMGVGSFALFGSWVALYALIFATLALLIAAVGNASMFRASSFGTIFALFFCFGLSSTTFAYLISVFFTQAKTASTLGVVLYLGGYFPAFAVTDAAVSTFVKGAGSLLSPTAFALGINLVGTLEDNGIGAKPGNSNVLINNWTIAYSLAFMLFDTLLYAVLAIYIDAVLPSSVRGWGVPRVWYFPCTRGFWREMGGYPPLGMKTAQPQSHSTPPTPPTNPYCEAPDPSQLAKSAGGRTVELCGLRKEFTTGEGRVKVAVNDLSLTLYMDEINVILGHNGAGKSTTISMLTGLLPTSGGSARVLGRDVGSELGAIRRDLGVCPQHDVLWGELTCQEHLVLFAAVKGVPRGEVEGAVTKALQEVGLTEKRHTLSSALSGGQKRKLSVCIALLGSSRFILLDEPTSGMDPYSRRSTWSILQNARAGRVLVLTTHFMDEADILGDRIAILAQGALACYGTPTFLKGAFNVGYTLTLIKGGGEGQQQQQQQQQQPLGPTILPLVQAFVPDATLGGEVAGEVTVRLPLHTSPAFPALLRELEDRGGELGISSLGVSVGSIESVFMSVAEGGGGGDVKGRGVVLSPTWLGWLRAKVWGGSGSRTSSVSAATPDTVVGNPIQQQQAAVQQQQHREVEMVAVSPSKGEGAVAAAFAEAAEVVAAAPPFPATSPSTPTTKFTSSPSLRLEARAVQKGWVTFFRHFRALFFKRCSYNKRDKRGLCFQLLIPVVMTAAGLWLLSSTFNFKQPEYLLSTAQFNAPSQSPGFGQPRSFAPTPKFPNLVPYANFKSSVPRVASPQITGLMGSIPTLNATTLGRLVLTPESTVGDAFGFSAAAGPLLPSSDFARLSTFLLSTRGDNGGGSVYGAYHLTRTNTSVPFQSPTDFSVPSGPGEALTVGILHNTTGRHSAPLFLNLLTSALYNLSTPPGQAPRTITARTFPLPLTASQSALFDAFFTFSSAIIIILAFSFFPAYQAIFVVKERESSSKHQQLISGVSIPAYWLSTLAFDLLTYLPPAALVIGITGAFNITAFTAAESSRSGAFLALFALYGLATSGFTYSLSFLFKSHSTAQNVTLFVNVAAIVLIIASLIMSQVQSTCRIDAAMRFIYRLIPGYSLGNGLVSLAFLTQLPIFDATCDVLNGIVRPPSAYKPYDAFNLNATGWNLIIMAITAPLYIALAIGLDFALANPRVRMWLALDRVVASAASLAAPPPCPPLPWTRMWWGRRPGWPVGGLPVT